MQRRDFAATGVTLPVVGQGTWNMEIDRAASVRALKRGLDLGMTHIDTAEMYGSGVVEEIVGEALGARRSEVYLVSKVLPTNASQRGTVEACERSLRRLKTDHLDLYLLHWPSSHPLEGTFVAFEELRDQGKVKGWGVSNFDVRRMDAALKLAGPGKIVCDQVLYHLGERAVEHALIDWCGKHQVALVAYSPFGQGDFPGAKSPAGRVLAEIAAAHRATPRQVALAFLLRWPHAFTIPKASRLEHVEENAGAARLELSPSDIARLDQAFPLGRSRPLPTL